MIACKTRIAKGAPTKEGKSSSHGAPLGDTEIIGAKKNMNWNNTPFYIPDNILACWRELGSLGDKKYIEWEEALSKIDTDLKENFSNSLSGDVEKWKIDEVIIKHKTELSAKKPFIATRKAKKNGVL